MFQKAKTAGMFGAICTMLLSILAIIPEFVHTSNTVRWLTSLISPIAISYGIHNVSVTMVERVIL